MHYTNTKYMSRLYFPINLCNYSIVFFFFFGVESTENTVLACYLSGQLQNICIAPITIHTTILLFKKLHVLTLVSNKNAAMLRYSKVIELHVVVLFFSKSITVLTMLLSRLPFNSTLLLSPLPSTALSRVHL